MSRAARAQRAADADLARPLQDAGQHDVHDPDAADQQRDRRERDHDDFEDALRPPLLGQQFGRNDHREVAACCDATPSGRRGSPRRWSRCPFPARAAGRCRRSRRGTGCSCLRAEGWPSTAARRSDCSGPAPGTPIVSLRALSCGPATPITRSHCSLTLMCRPTASSGPKSAAFAPSPSTATGVARSFSPSSKKRPAAMRRLPIGMYDGVDAVDRRHVALRFRQHLRRHRSACAACRR